MNKFVSNFKNLIIVLSLIVVTGLTVAGFCFASFNKAEADQTPNATPINSEQDLPTSSGDYYLNVTLDDGFTSDWNIPSGVTINLDLSGHTLRPGNIYRVGRGAQINIASNATLNLTNTGIGGGILNSTNSAAQPIGGLFEYKGGCFYVQANGTLNINDVYINGNVIYKYNTAYTYETHFYGGVIYNEGTVNLTNVEATNNYLTYEPGVPYSIDTIIEHQYYGGVVYSKGGKVTFDNCDFSNNYAYSGGVLYATGSTNVEINDSEFSYNLAGLYTYDTNWSWNKYPYGSCICCVNGPKLTVNNSYFHENGDYQNPDALWYDLPWTPMNGSDVTRYAYTASGGAIAAINSEVNFKTTSEDNYTRFVNNFGFYGGALYSTGSTITVEAQGDLIDYVLFEQNTALYGGAMYLQDGKTTLKGGKFSNNGVLYVPNEWRGIIRPGSSTLGGWGGAIDATAYGSGIEESILDIYDCQIMDNYASFEGGGIYIDLDTMVNIYDGTFRNNAATSPNFYPSGNAEGGAIKNEGELYIYAGDFRFNKAHNPMWRNAYGGCICNTGKLTLLKANGSDNYPVITANSSDNGAGIANIDTRMRQYPVINLYDCDISYNTAEYYCGLLNGPGALTYMHGGYIGNNVATNCAGVGNYGGFIMFDGSIAENQAVSFAGGIYSYGQLGSDWTRSYIPDPSYKAALELYGGNIENNYGEGVLVDYKSTIVFNNPTISSETVKIEGNHTDSPTYSNYQNATNLVINAADGADVFVELESGFNPSSVTGFSFVDIPLDYSNDSVEQSEIYKGLQKGYSQISSGRLTESYKENVASGVGIYDCFFYEASIGAQIGGTIEMPSKTDTDEIWVVQHKHVFEYVAGTAATGDANTIYYYCQDPKDEGCYFHAHKDIKLVLNAETVVYDGNAHEASYEENISYYVDAEIPAIEYYNMENPSDKLSGAPKDVGSYEARLKLDGATAIAPFTIYKYISKTMAQADSYTFQFDGTPKTPVVTVTDGATDITDKMEISGDTTATNIGKYVISIKPKTINEYMGDTYIVWAITASGDPIVLKPEMLVVDKTSYVYDGSEKTPTITVKDGGTDITDQLFISGELSASDIGAYSIVVSGCEFDEEGHRTDSAYAGILSKGWMITGEAGKKMITENMISITPDTFDYDGSVKTPVITVKDGDTDLIEGGFVTLSGDTSASEPGSYAIVVSANENKNASTYYGSAAATWKINSSVIPVPTPGGGGGSAVDVLTSTAQTDDPLPIALISIFMGIAFGVFLTVRKLVK